MSDRVERTRIEVFPAHLTAQEMAPGDFLLVRRRGLIQTGIRLGQTIRYRGRNAALRSAFPGIRYSYTSWSHAALVVSRGGDLVEALTRGVCRGHIGEYANVDYVLVRTFADAHDQVEICEYADSIVGDRYGWAEIATNLLSIAPGWHLTFGIPSSHICSGVVAEAQLRAGWIFHDYDPADMNPADLAWVFDVPELLHTYGPVAMTRRVVR